jgi:nicotinamide-nucleotide amidase
MRIDVVAIGNEVLSGVVVNSNAAYISRELFKAGFEVSSHSVLPDEGSQLREGLSSAIQHNDLVICTGGLGPTLDDNTRAVVAEILRCGFRLDERVAAQLKQRFGDKLATLKDQATIPDKAEILLNEVGTAPGLIFDLRTCVLILLPGIPLEMQSLLRQVVPYLQKRFALSQRIYREAVHLFHVSEHPVDEYLRELQAKHPDVLFGIYPDQGLCAVRLGFKAAHEIEAQQKLAPLREAIKQRFPQHVFESPSGTIEETVHQLFINKGWTLATAESCTGGAIATRLTTLSGASQYYKGSVVCYSNESKLDLLGVSPQALQQEGAVSEQVAGQMAEGIVKAMKSDFGIAVTGVAGPTGGTVHKPVGTVYVAVVRRGEATRISLLQIVGDRTKIIRRSANYALGEIYKYASFTAG